jgi:AraC-like DNA-binding protein
MVVAAAAARGVPPARLLAAVGLDPQLLIGPDGRVEAEPALRAWQVAAELCGDPWFGLSVADQFPLDYLGGLGVAVHGSATLGDGLRRFARFFPLIHQLAGLELVEDARALRLRFVPQVEVAPAQLRHPTECLLAVLVRLARRTTGAEVRPTAVALRHAEPPELSGYSRAFGVAPRFGEPDYELVFDRAVLDTPQLAPDGALLELAERHLHRRCGDLPPAETFAGRVRRVLGEELEFGEPTLPRLAERLRMSERTLQRRLGGEGTSVQALLDELRRELSLRRLAESDQTIAEIAFRLGFAEVRAFHRAFKRWTGSTPAAYRQARTAS